MDPLDRLRVLCLREADVTERLSHGEPRTTKKLEATCVLDADWDDIADIVADAYDQVANKR